MTQQKAPVALRESILTNSRWGIASIIALLTGIFAAIVFLAIGGFMPHAGTLINIGFPLGSAGLAGLGSMAEIFLGLIGLAKDKKRLVSVVSLVLALVFLCWLIWITFGTVLGYLCSMNASGGGC
jgi:hypothetical protein